MSDLIARLPRELRPRKGSFIFPRIVGAIIIFAVLGITLGVVMVLAGGQAVGLAVAAGLGVFAAGTAFVYWTALVAFRKEHYELHPTHLVCRHGSIVSDESTELDIRNVTHVKLRLPWLRYKFFRVGDVLIESAGSGGSEVAMRSIREPEQVYDDMKALLQHNGYALGCETLLHVEQPDLVGVILECVGLWLAACFALAFTVAEIWFDAGGSQSVNIVLGVIGVVSVFGSFGAVAIHFLDLRRRTYKVYNDAVVYEEGFLTRDNAFIPYENIADANSKKNLLDMILGLSDVMVSCQGSGSEIKFRRLRKGALLTEAVDQLVREASTKARPQPPAAVISAVTDDGEPMAELPAARPAVEMVAPEDAWTADLKMDTQRALVPIVLMLPAFPIWLAATIAKFIQVSATKYSVRPHSVGSAYSFLSVSEREYAYDKITGMVIKSNPWDRLFKTVTVRLWSIGAPEPMDLMHIKRDQIDLDALLRQVGIPAATEECYEAQCAFSPGAWLSARLPAAIGIGLLTLIIVIGALAAHTAVLLFLVPLYIITGLYMGYYYALYGKQRLTFYARHVEAATGLFWVNRYHARYANVKKLQLTRYPGSALGSVKVFVAGEQRIVKGKQGKGADAGQQGAVVPYSFTGSYITDLETKKALLDDLILGRVTARSDAAPAQPLEVLKEGKPALGNSMFKLVVGSVIAAPMIALLPLTIPFCMVSVRRWTYRVEAGRVMATWGILYQSQVTVTFDSIDSLKHRQGLLGKMFKNGQVTLLTAGSSMPDLVLADLPDYEPFYDVIRKHYGQA